LLPPHPPLAATGGTALPDCHPDLEALDAPQLADAADADDLSFPHDLHARAGLRDLAGNVRGKKDGSAFLPRLFGHAVELLLVQGIEAARRLVEDEDARAVHEGLDEDDLPLVPGRVLP